MSIPFRDRTESGARLAEKLSEYEHRTDVVVLGLASGGIPVAFEVAMRLDVQLDVFLVRKLGVPGHEELAMGAVATGGVMVLNESVLRSLQITEDAIERVRARESQELERRENLYRNDLPPAPVAQKTALLIDDGVATGSTMRAAIEALKRLGPARIVVAIPVASPSVCAALEAEVDEVLCLDTPEPFYAVGYWYEDFAQTTDEDIQGLLARAGSRQSSSSTR